MPTRPLPSELHGVRENAWRAIAPIKPADDATKFITTKISEGVYASGRTTAGDKLPPYYLVYFLLVKLLGFEDLGRSEKIAWSIPIDFQGTGFLIDHRKFGVGVFVGDTDNHEQEATKIVELIHRGVKAARPFFRWIADEAVHGSQFNVSNEGKTLRDRYEFFRGLYTSAAVEAAAHEGESIVKKGENDQGSSWATVEWPCVELRQKAEWLGSAAIDAFFAWTEHIFILLAILQGNITTGGEFTNLIGADWSDKFKAVLPVDDPTIKKYYDDLVVIRRLTRNFVAHGSFGKNGEALHFHSETGSVPVTLDPASSVPHFSLGLDRPLHSAQAIQTIDEFAELLWEGPRAPARLYVEESGLPVILPMASDGTYAKAMSSSEAMGDFLNHLVRRFDDAANMDW